MHQGITVQVSEDDRVRLGAIVADRNSPQKHVWRARIVLMTADGIGTNTIMRQTGKSKVTVWRWRERFMAQGVDGLLRDKTRPSRIPRLPATVHERTVALTQTDPPGEMTHWTAQMMAKQVGISVSSRPVRMPRRSPSSTSIHKFLVRDTRCYERRSGSRQCRVGKPQVDSSIP